MLYTITIPINISNSADPSAILDIAIDAAEVMATDIEDMLDASAEVNQELGGAMVMDHPTSTTELSCRNGESHATSMNVVLS